MTRRTAPLQVNQLIGGLNTEYNPLNAPIEASKDERNMDINRDGSRSRRLGFNYESEYELIDSGVYNQPDLSLATNIYRWDNAGGDISKYLLVVQIGNNLQVFDLDENTISTNVVFSTDFDISTYDKIFSFAVVDGLLVVCTGAKEIKVYEYNSGSITETTSTLKIRDLFGVQAFDASVELTIPEYIERRPSTLTDTHLYNLRNQTFGRARIIANTENSGDPVVAFYNEASKYPSNADSVNYSLYADAGDTDNRTIERFFPKNLRKNPPGSFEAPKGYFIIDALERGTSRLAVEANLRVTDTDLTRSVATLPVDRTPGGPTVVTEHAGRAWFAGFSGVVEGGDSKSPRMSSYVLFSSLVRNKTDIGKCYQEADPTSNNDSAIVDTDGGFIRIDEAYGIKQLISLGDSLFVFAENGVWSITGQGGFSAVSYEVRKIINRGCVSSNSVVLAEKEIYMWAEDAIYRVVENQYGVWDYEDITTQKIKTFYLDIPVVDKRICIGKYDPYEKQIHWVYNTTSATENNELIFNIVYQAFTKRVVSNDHFIVGVGEGQPYKANNTTFDVTVEGVVVTVSGVDVTITYPYRSDSSKDLVYLVIDNITDTIEYSFGQYVDQTYYDWDDVDTSAYIITSEITAGDGRARKQTPHLHCFFRKTEDSFDSNLVARNQSSCLLSTRWQWHNSSSGGKWSTPRQAYRNTRPYSPSMPDEVYDDGQTLISTKNKIRGFGKALSFKFESEEGKSFHIYGWAFNLTASNEE